MTEFDEPTNPRTCARCGAPIPRERSMSNYCSNACDAKGVMEPPSEPVAPPTDPLDAIEAYNRGVVLGLTTRFLRGMSTSLNEKNAARGLQLIERFCENQRNLLTILGNAAPVKHRRKLSLANPIAQYSIGYSEDSADGLSSALGASEPDEETFGAQALKRLMDTITGAVGALNKPKETSPNRARKAEIELAEAKLRAANMLGDNDLIASRRAVLRELLKNEDEAPPPLAMPPAQPSGEHVRKEDWERAHDMESVDKHPCTDWWWQDCMCEGTCMCHWVQPQEKTP